MNCSYRSDDGEKKKGKNGKVKKKKKKKDNSDDDSDESSDSGMFAVSIQVVYFSIVLNSFLELDDIFTSDNS